jgi:hypothetical protein
MQHCIRREGRMSSKLVVSMLMLPLVLFACESKKAPNSTSAKQVAKLQAEPPTEASQNAPPSDALKEVDILPGEVTTIDLARWDDKVAAKRFLDLVLSGTAAEIRAAIGAGAKLNYGDWYEGMQSSGFTPLMMAAGRNPSIEVIEALIAAGAKVNVYDKYLGWDALILASELNSNEGVVQMLLDKGARIDARLNSGDTALMRAADANSNVEVIKCLIKYGASVNDVNALGMSPLMLAAYHNPNEGVVLELLRAGADKEAVSIERKKAIDYARESHSKGTFLEAIAALQ